MNENAALLLLPNTDTQRRKSGAEQQAQKQKEGALSFQNDGKK